MPQRSSLTETIKAEILSDLNQNGYQNQVFRTDPNTVEAIKNDVLAQIEAEQIKWDSNPYFIPQRGAVDRAVVENIKNELLAELAGSPNGRMASQDSWRNLLSDRNIDRRINQQYNNLQNLRGEIKKGLKAARNSEQQLNRISDPQVRQTVDTIIREARLEGIPLDNVINALNSNSGAGGNLRQQVGGWINSSTGRSFLMGAGLSLAIVFLLPATRGGLRKMGVKMLEGSMDIADQTRSVFGKAREGFEDMIAEANYNNLQESAGFPMETPEQTIMEDPLDNDPTH